MAPGELSWSRIGRAGAVVLLLGVLLLALGIAYERERLRSDAGESFQQSTRLVDGYLRAQLQAAQSIARLIEERHRDIRDPEGVRVRTLPTLGAWQLEAVIRDGRAERPRGAATGLLPWSPALEREVAAVLAMDSSALSLLSYNRETPWVYYTSARHWLYLFPAVSPATFRFSRAVHARPFWAITGPARNPARRETLSGLYEDAAGHGLMITASAPVYAGERFLGVASLDLGLTLLQDLLADHGRPGDLLLVDRLGFIVARQGGFNLQERYDLPEDRTRHWTGPDGSEWRAAPVAEGRLWLLQRLTLPEMVATSLGHSMPAVLLFGLVGMVLVLGSRLQAAMAALAHQARRDPLTGALNRRGLFEEMPALQALARRRGKTLAIALLDVDFFKRVNDTYGHEQGDKVLRALAGALERQLRDYDLVCRWGGEEFVVAMLVESPGDAPPLAERLRQAVAMAVLRDALLSVTVSGGLAFWCPGEALEATVGRADELLYLAKTSGRNRLEAEPLPAE